MSKAIYSGYKKAISRRRGAFSNLLAFYKGIPQRNLAIRPVMHRSPGSYGRLAE